jgi:hypothetical protein
MQSHQAPGFKGGLPERRRTAGRQLGDEDLLAARDAGRCVRATREYHKLFHNRQRLEPFRVVELEVVAEVERCR